MKKLKITLIAACAVLVSGTSMGGAYSDAADWGVGALNDTGNWIDGAWHDTGDWFVDAKQYGVRSVAGNGNTHFYVTNCSSKQYIEAKTYKHKDTIYRWALSTKNIGRGNTKTLKCMGEGKGKCKFQVKLPGAKFTNKKKRSRGVIKQGEYLKVTVSSNKRVRTSIHKSLPSCN